MSAPQRLLSSLSSQRRSGGWSSIARQTQPHECKLHVLKDEDKRETYDQRQASGGGPDDFSGSHPFGDIFTHQGLGGYLTDTLSIPMPPELSPPRCGQVSPLATASHRLKPWKSRRRQGARWRLHTAVYA
uniref:Uncharacterized protein n=1 Tax=Oryza glumipatula TaxID=40148 RepID=A0A0E0BHP7_9ORYZ